MDEEQRKRLVARLGEKATTELEVKVFGVNSGKAPLGEGAADEFLNLRAQVLWGARAWIRAGGGFEPDDELEKDLANGALAAQDGVTLAVDDLLFAKDQSTGADRGLYTVTSLGDGSNPYVLRPSWDRLRGILAAVDGMVAGIGPAAPWMAPSPFGKTPKAPPPKPHDRSREQERRLKQQARAGRAHRA